LKEKEMTLKEKEMALKKTKKTKETHDELTTDELDLVSGGYYNNGPPMNVLKDGECK
jgi:hypothetical protein